MTIYSILYITNEWKPLWQPVQQHIQPTLPSSWKGWWNCFCALGILGGGYTRTANRTDGQCTQYDLFTHPLQYQCLYFSRHICYCLILKKKVAEQKIMKSKSNTHSQQARGKKHIVSILISLTESRNMASVTHHLLPLLSSAKWKKMERSWYLWEWKREVDRETENLNRKAQKTLGYTRNIL